MMRRCRSQANFSRQPQLPPSLITMDYHIARDSQKLGIFSEQDIQSGLASGRFLMTDLHWSEGMTDWKQIGSSFAGSALPASEFNPYAAPQSNVISPAMLNSLPLASRGARLGAAMLDGLMLFMIIAVPLLAGIYLMERGKNSSSGLPVSSIVWFWIAGAAFLAYLIYNIVIMTTRGQTLGKKWLGIRVVTNPDGQNPGFVKNVVLRAFVNGIIGNIVPFYPIIDACFIFREDRRCLHDMIADTIVVEDKTLS
jgi:uncharacterized RDD family membrane protein YckC